MAEERSGRRSAATGETRRRVRNGQLAFWLCLGLAAAVIACWSLFLAPPLEPRGSLVQLQGFAAGGEPVGAEWDVYVTEDGTARPLTDEGDGVYSGLAYDGQTFLASCMLEDDLGNALLEIPTSYSTALLLDGELLYCDTVLRTTAAGDFELAPLDSMRLEPLLVSLPPDYAGRELTIVQSQYSGADDPAPACFIPAVTLLSVMRYNSERLAEGADTFYPGIALFILGLLLFTVMAVSAGNGAPAAPAALLSSFCLLWTVWLYVTSVPLQLLEYYEPLPNISLFYYGATTCLVLFLAEFAQGQVKAVLRVLALLPAVCAAAVTLLHGEGTAAAELPDWLQMAALTAGIIMACVQAGHVAFYAEFVRLFAWTLAGFGVFTAWQAWTGSGWYRFFAVNVTGPYPDISYLSTMVQVLLVIVCSGSLIRAFIRMLYRRRLEAALAEERRLMSESSLRQFRRQAYETAAVQHDIRRHLGVIGLYLQQDQVPEALSYLDQIGLQLDNVAKTVSTDNTVIDLILNSKLAEMRDLGIRADVLAEKLPSQLPITEAELSSLLLNTLDNAIRAAQAAAEKTVSVQIYVRNGFLYYSCRNAAPVPGASEKYPRSGRGYGLGIVRQIAENHGGLAKVEQDGGMFLITCVLALVSPETETK